VLLRCRIRAVTLEDNGQSSLSELFAITDEPAGSCSPYEYPTCILDQTFYHVFSKPASIQSRFPPDESQIVFKVNKDIVRYNRW
jgi:hypothetical protein